MSKYEILIFKNKAKLAEHKATNDALLKKDVNKAQTLNSITQIYESCVQVNEDMAQIYDVIVQTIQAYIKANNESFQICGPKDSSKYKLAPICKAYFKTNFELYQECVRSDKLCDAMVNELRASDSDLRNFASQGYAKEVSNYQKEASVYRKIASQYRHYITQCRLNAAPNAFKFQPWSSIAEISETNQFALQTVTLKSIKLHVLCVDAII